MRGIRNIRAEKRVEAARWVEAYVVGAEADRGGTRRRRPPSRRSRACARCTSSPPPEEAPSDGVVTAVLPVGRVVLPMAGLFDLDAERARLEKQIGEAEGEVGRLEAKLGDEQFTSRAPEQVVAKEQERLATARTRLEGLRESLAEVG